MSNPSETGPGQKTNPQEFTLHRQLARTTAMLPDPPGTVRTADGKFAKGTAGGPGWTKAKRADLVSIAVRHALSVGQTLEQRLALVMDALYVQALTGNVAAAKLLLDKLGEADEQKLNVSIELPLEERARRVAELLRTARDRRILHQLVGTDDVQVPDDQP